MKQMIDYYLLTKAQCPLCLQALQMIQQLPLEEPINLHLVDIAQQTELVEEYRTLVPVLVRGLDDQELKWPFNDQQLMEFIDR